MARRTRVASKRVRLNSLQRLEDRRLLAGDVCFPLSPEDSTSQPAVASAQTAQTQVTEPYGPVPLQSSAVAGPESPDGTVATIVSIFSDTKEEGNPLSTRPAANASSPAPETIDFTVMLNEPAPGPISVEVSTSDDTAKALLVERLVTGLANPVYVTSPPGDTDRLFIVEQRDENNNALSNASFARIKILNLNTGLVNATPFLEIDDANRNNGEGGLIGLAFHPDYANNGRFFVNMTDNNSPGVTRIREYQVSASDPDVADASSEKTIMSVVQPFGNHNGGWMDFGPDGYLYIALGDGGSGHDPGNRAQSLSTLLGKTLRIDIDGDDFPTDAGKNYAIPASNPFAGAIPGLDEIWDYGLRNHYRNSFDRETGDLYYADVGQARREEINVQPAGSPGGLNYGWRLREGIIATPTGGVGGAKPPGAIDPIFDYSNGIDDYEGESVTGGYVYRGPIEDLQGQYFFADFIRSHIWGLTYNGDAPTSHDGSNFDGLVDYTGLLQPDAGTINSISSFGEDAQGNLYIVDYGGEVFVLRNGADYVPTTETINFVTGEQTKTFSVPVVHDILKESDETFFATIDSVSGATPGTDQAIGTIRNDDGVPVVTDVQIADGSNQRSIISSLTVTFDGVVDVDADDFSLVNLGTTAVPSSTDVTSLMVDRRVVGLQTIATITFGSGDSVMDRSSGNSLENGNYELSYNGGLIAGAADDFFRIFGDKDGNGTTNFGDFSSAFLPAFGAMLGDPEFDDAMDFNGDGNVNFADFAGGFLPNFGMSN